MKEGWTKRRLAEVISLEYGKPLPNDKRCVGGGFPAYGANGIKCYAVEPYWDHPSIIVGRKGTAGAVNLVESGFWPLDVTYFVTFDVSQYDRKFLYFMLVSLDLPALATGVKPGINRNVIYSIEQNFPALFEQKDIVALLDEAFEGIDTAVANTENNLVNVREIFESYRNEVFGNPLESWQSVELGELCIIKHGFAFKSEFFTTQSDYVVLTPGSFYEHGGFRDQGKKTKYYEGDIPDGYLLEKGDFLFAMTEQAAGLLGSSLVVPESSRYLHNQRLGLVQPKDGIEWHNDFFFHQFNTPLFREAVQATASGTKVRHTSPKKLCAIPVVYPLSQEEQSQVANKLNGLWEETQRLEAIYQQKLTALAELKQSLLQKALSGELTVREAEAAVRGGDDMTPRPDANRHLAGQPDGRSTVGCGTRQCLADPSENGRSL